MTRPEHTNGRDLTFSKWLREHGPDSSTGYSVTDLDYVIWNWSPGNERMMIVEVKTYGKALSTGQKMQMRRLDDWIRAGIAATGAAYRYYGFLVVTFEGTTFDDGAVWVQSVQSDNRIRVRTETALMSLLSFGIFYPSNL